MRKLYDKHRAKLQYLLVGGWNTIFGYAVFVALYYWTARFNFHYEIVLILSQIINVTSAYILYKKFVFRTKGNFIREYCRFCAFYWLSFAANLVLLPLLVEGLHQNPMLSQGLLTVGTAMTSYFWHTNYTFTLVSKTGSR